MDVVEVHDALGRNTVSRRSEHELGDKPIAAARSLADEIEEIALRVSSLPVRDGRSPDAILGYDDAGLPT